MPFNQKRTLLHNIHTLFVSNIKRNKDEEQECLQFGICAAQAQSPISEDLYFG
tara:strand:+ start:115 stop:273 length:159 start_codon:yes stop_codon:yes gene_type:complete